MEQKVFDVVVVGGGVAGLAAAAALKKAWPSCKLIILEADRTWGGRVAKASPTIFCDGSAVSVPAELKCDDVLSDKYPFDVGASWIHGTGDNALYADIVVPSGVKTYVSNEGLYAKGVPWTLRFSHHPDGITPPPERAVAELFMMFQEHVLKRLDSPQPYFAEAKSPEDLRTMSVDRPMDYLLKRLELVEWRHAAAPLSSEDRKKILSFFRDSVAEYCGTDLSRVGLNQWTADSDYDGQHVFSFNLYGATVAELHKRLQNNRIILTNVPVSSIILDEEDDNNKDTKDSKDTKESKDNNTTTSSSGGNAAATSSTASQSGQMPAAMKHWFNGKNVTIKTATGKTAYSRYVIVTVSLGCLKAAELQFIPPLPPSKLAAISELGFGVFNKLFLTFSRHFWETRTYINARNMAQGGDVPMLPGEYVGIVNHNPRTKFPITVDPRTGRPVFNRDLHFYNPRRFTGRGTLIAFFYGDDAAWLERVRDEVVADAVCGEIESAYGIKVLRPETVCKVEQDGHVEPLIISYQDETPSRKPLVVPTPTTPAASSSSSSSASSSSSSSSSAAVSTHPEAETTLTGMLMTRWYADRHQFGSFAYVTPEGNSTTVDRLAAPIANIIFFAGEATSKSHIGTVSGAYETGLRAARNIVEEELRQRKKKQAFLESSSTPEAGKAS